MRASSGIALPAPGAPTPRTAHEPLVVVPPEFGGPAAMVPPEFGGPGGRLLSPLQDSRLLPRTPTPRNHPMADPEHLAILKQGVDAWNRWRQENPNTRPDLYRAHLIGAKLRRADLRYCEGRKRCQAPLLSS